ncbi:MAG TPA: molecular chaperone DnaJ [Actinomycetota bacterium]|nr:molecular chaperone DnaJ [Actinomycetota bacterium]
MADYYEILGVPRDATPDDIKRAYRKLARQYHPDANPGDPGAVDRFKEINNANEVLSDPAKRQRYDQFGDERVGAGAAGFGDFGGISDLFATFFGGGFGGGGGARRGPGRGADVLAEIELTLEEAADGVERDVEVTTLGMCAECDGSGAAPGTFPTRCTDCGGTGEIRTVRRTMLGNVMTAATCPRCRGAGQEIASPCPNCRGRGRVEATDTLTVQIPPGVDDGAQLRVSGRGEAGVRGGRSGDLYVAIRVLPHETFRRAGDDLGCEVAVPMTVAALGGTITIPTLEGDEEVEVAAGTQPGEVKRLRGRGMPRLGGRGRGELVVLLKVETPTELDDEQAELLQRFAKLRDERAGGKGLFDRIKEAFQ